MHDDQVRPGLLQISHPDIRDIGRFEVHPPQAGQSLQMHQTGVGDRRVRQGQVLKTLQVLQNVRSPVPTNQSLMRRSSQRHIDDSLATE
jgi:hypothetical protein